MKNESVNWTDDRVETLKKLWAEGLSASQIAGEMGGVTRNAVIGKVHRLGLAGRAKPAPAANRPRRAKPAAPAPVRAPQPVSRGATALAPVFQAEVVVEAAPQPVGNVVPMGQRCSIMQLNESTCRWPVGDPGREDFYFCGGKSQAGIPYCTFHARIAYQPVVDRKRDRRVARG
jgi:GcrA cell cycle regulator